ARFATAVILMALLVLTIRRTLVYRNPATLYSDTIARNPQCVIAHANLALYLNDVGQLDEALKFAREAVRLDATEPAAQNDLGLVLLRRGERSGFEPGQLEEAVGHLKECLKLNPDYPSAHSNLAYAMMLTGHPDVALTHLTRFAELDPNNARAH